VKPDGIEALQTIPSFSGFTKFLALGEYVVFDFWLKIQMLATPNPFALEECVVLVFWLKF